MKEISAKQEKRNLIFYPLGTVGRDMIYSLFTNYIMLFILYTRNLTDAQLGAVTAIMVAARVFDALNDPIMGNIIERTRSKWGKFKPWLLIGIISTCVVVYLAFNTNLDGWNFIWFFGIIYFMYSITYTMHDISYWGMVPALSSDGDKRNSFTARATLFAGIGGTLASLLIPIFTAGQYALGGTTRIAYGRIALVICILTPLFILFTLFGVRENREDMKTEAPKVSFKKIIKTIGGNDQLLWICLIFLIQQIGNGIVLGGVGANYIYFEFGYEGGLYGTFQTVGLAATALLMIFYPAISKKFHRQKLVLYMGIIATVGYAIQIAAGFILPAEMYKFWILTLGFMAANLGQYGLYLIMMISIINTVEYNELKHGTRDEAIITSMRPFLTKLASSFTVIITTVSYVICRVTTYTNTISDLEKDAEKGLITAEQKAESIDAVVKSVANGQKNGLLLAMTLLPCILMLIACVLYRRFYKLDEERYDEIRAQIEARKNA
ncbi:MAG: glycoside-pentoside-hexuronide (GPH):cation symporter [Lachnospiraceae bacterium]|nr:glycoside-pentoside-hexuronide (GPH):cation symporter [Lachnospiraceae bacterium]